ncbi:acyl carrier protein [Prochlorothrix hollandica]|uniref:Acyl carrier protein n=1 Tax=Prochlorothrix hollandica PCC 9006 = CALU 1027 TaxID=317619 RepID=A0A0M2PPA1_PROHO|nr:phosphopantetheine-binding protein [Prochlorothrix hollandica]KKI98405.1 acyl carrier protein [Prochlorothrix hollandica PCC 9006 = CALU 1027]
MSSTIIEQLKLIITNELDTNLSVDELNESTSLFEDGLGFDSIATVELISLVEKHFEIEFSDAELNPENFSNLKILADFIVSKQ